MTEQNQYQELESVFTFDARTEKQPLNVYQITVEWKDDKDQRREATYRVFATSPAELEDNYTGKNGSSKLVDYKVVKPRKNERERMEALNELRQLLEPGDTLHTVLRHVSSSGMSRNIDVYLLSAENGEVKQRWLSSLVARALGARMAKRDNGIIVGGAGMDMGFHIVSSVSRAMYPYGFTCVGDKCRSNDHSNGDRNRAPHHHASGDYAISQRWL